MQTTAELEKLDAVLDEVMQPQNQSRVAGESAPKSQSAHAGHELAERVQNLEAGLMSLSQSLSRLSSGCRAQNALLHVRLDKLAVKDNAGPTIDSVEQLTVCGGCTTLMDSSAQETITDEACPEGYDSIPNLDALHELQENCKSLRNPWQSELDEVKSLLTGRITEVEQQLTKITTYSNDLARDEQDNDESTGVSKSAADDLVPPRLKPGKTVYSLEEETESVYEFGASTWDIIVFMGSTTIGHGTSMVIACLVFIKLAIQFTFTAVVFINFTLPSIGQDDIDGAKSWRERIGHHLEYVDELTHWSLTSRACGHDSALELSAKQYIMITDLQDYLKLKETGYKSAFHGGTLCMVALSCWYLMVSEELHAAFDLFRAISAVTSFDGGRTKVVRDGEGGYCLQRVSYRKYVLAAFCLFYRLGIIGVLFYSGTLFLTYTINTTQLLLNALALGIIVDIDHVVFESLATASLRHLMAKMQPIIMPRWSHFKGIDMKSCSLLLLLPTGLLFVYITCVSPMLHDLDRLFDAYCGGNKDFAWSMSKLDIVMMAPTSKYNGSQSTEAALSRAVGEALGQSTAADRSQMEFSIWTPSLTRLMAESRYTFQESLDTLQPLCVDMDDYLPALRYLQAIHGGSVSNCTDAKSWCTSVSYLPDLKPDGGKGVITRALCPVTCGCFDLRSPVFLVDGCPTSCTSMANEQYVRSLRLNGSCTQEFSPDELRTFPFFASWIHQMKTYAQSKFPVNGSYGIKVLQAADSLWQHGCAAIDHHLAGDFEPCQDWGPLPFRTLRNLCPLTCGCLRGDTETKVSCPWSCHYCSDEFCTDVGPNCAAGTTTEPCSCSQGMSVVYAEDALGYSRYTCCTDATGKKDVCGTFTEDMYCDICGGAQLNENLSYTYLGIARECLVGATSCKIAHQCGNTCEGIQNFHSGSTNCCTYCDICGDATLNESAMFTYPSGFVESCKYTAETCRIPQQCGWPWVQAARTCNGLQEWFLGSTSCCISGHV